MNRRSLQFLIVFLLPAIIGADKKTDSRRCAHCQMYRNGSCLHPLGFIPPMTECGATHSRCGTILMRVMNMIILPGRNVQFGITFEDTEVFALFKGCAQEYYCWRTDVDYTVFGVSRNKCEECIGDGCNLETNLYPPGLRITSTARKHTSVLLLCVFSFLLLLLKTK